MRVMAPRLAVADVGVAVKLRMFVLIEIAPVVAVMGLLTAVVPVPSVCVIEAALRVLLTLTFAAREMVRAPTPETVLPKVMSPLPELRVRLKVAPVTEPKRRLAPVPGEPPV